MKIAARIAASAAAGALLVGIAAPAIAQDRDWSDPRLGREIGDAVSDMVGVLGRAMEDARRNVRLPGDGRPDYRGIDSRSAAVDACSLAAEDEARRVGYHARVDDIDDVDSYAQDSWDVEGTVETYDDYREGRSGERRFTCSVRYGAVEHVYVEGAEYAYRW